MLVNKQKSGRLGQGCDKYCTHKVLPHTTNPKNQHFLTTTPSRTYVAIPRARGILPRHNKTGHRNREPASPTRDAYMRPKSQSTTVYHTETKVSGSRPGPAHCYIVFCRQQIQADEGQGLSPHPETEASGNHKE